MRFFTSIFLIIICFAAQAQLPEFAPLGTTWSYGVFNFGPTYYTAKCEVNERDTILGVPCKKGPGVDPFYTDSLRVFKYQEDLNEWLLWFDFGVKKDSSWEWIRYNFGDIDTIIVDVLASGDTVINGFNLPYLDVKTPETKCGYRFGFSPERLVWGIGPLFGGLNSPCGTDPSFENLICYDSPVIGNIFDPIPPYLVSCDTFVSVGMPDVPLIKIDFSPNPSTASTWLSMKGELPPLGTQILIYDIQGRLMQKHDLPANASRFELPVESLKPGVYMIALHADGELLVREKLIKQ
ncbi:MAG: T9SS type A sorting domain-containing protein [Bacteroidia bacterium]